ncbi:hypothetical protein [Terriglobus sp. TAA 43]|uniref:hypothetical protein n=1 Tax=Terriglobus sp. TAA 43 TaxID=278961 RepID=UPI000648181A|nr:hypothetical protein [Terriglobus sp. TAA 43]
MRRIAAASFVSAVFLTGCHSHYIQTTITNQSGADINVVQVEYPGASFGTQRIANGASFHYRFKLLGTGDLKLTWTDASYQEHTLKGLHLDEGQEGTLVINFPSQSQANFQPSLKP